MRLRVEALTLRLRVDCFLDLLFFESRASQSSPAAPSSFSGVVKSYTSFWCWEAAMAAAAEVVYCELVALALFDALAFWRVMRGLAIFSIGRCSFEELFRFLC